MKKDYYQILGVERGATQDEIKAAYRNLAKDNHPDRFQDPAEREGAETKFKEMTEAYNVLSNPQKRREYDNPPRRGGFGFNFTNMGANSSFFFDAKPLEIGVNASVEDVMNGAKRGIRYKRRAVCDDCSGSGMGQSNTVARCVHCGGRGYESIGFMNMTCRVCGGSGMVNSRFCGKCNGDGRAEKEENLVVDIPKGAGPSNTLRIVGAGHYSKMNSRFSDLYIWVNVRNPSHGMFAVDFPHCRTVVPVTYKTAVLGGKVDVVTPHGMASVNVPPGTVHGTYLRLSGKGLMTAPNSNVYGDFIVTVEIDIPKVSGGSEELLKKLDDDSLVHERVTGYKLKIDSFSDQN